jgi:hypothetical protein
MTLSLYPPVEIPTSTYFFFRSLVGPTARMNATFCNVISLPGIERRLRGRPTRSLSNKLAKLFPLQERLV